MSENQARPTVRLVRISIVTTERSVFTNRRCPDFLTHTTFFQLSSLPLQVSLFFHCHLLALWSVFYVGIAAWKHRALYYPNSAFAWEAAAAVACATTEASCIDLATRGNLTERTDPLVWGAFLAVPAALGHVFFTVWQTYVLRIDIVVNGIMLVFISFEFLMSIATFLSFRKKDYM
mmetsp:Transcript_24702/g.56804  ORF Transcript_24702/g.56804 Transcript_24702/m.56804 type:complete len:176 (-) Transcript_24702:843-1370(-)